MWYTYTIIATLLISAELVYFRIAPETHLQRDQGSEKL